MVDRGTAGGEGDRLGEPAYITQACRIKDRIKRCGRSSTQIRCSPAGAIVRVSDQVMATAGQCPSGWNNQVPAIFRHDTVCEFAGSLCMNSAGQVASLERQMLICVAGDGATGEGYVAVVVDGAARVAPPGRVIGDGAVCQCGRSAIRNTAPRTRGKKGAGLIAVYGGVDNRERSAVGDAISSSLAAVIVSHC